MRIEWSNDQPLRGQAEWTYTHGRRIMQGNDGPGIAAAPEPGGDKIMCPGAADHPRLRLGGRLRREQRDNGMMRLSVCKTTAS